MYYYNETVFDTVDLVPFVSGVGEGIKGAKAATKMADKVDDVADVAKALDKNRVVVRPINCLKINPC